MNLTLTKNVWAVGRNYAAHALEMSAEIPAEPFFFLKSGSTIETQPIIHLPSWSNDVHHEIELAFWVNDNLQLSHIALALDLTARDKQNLAKTKGLPWTQAKSFKASCPISPWVSLNDIQNMEKLEFSLKKNTELAQIGHYKNMLFKPNELLNYVKNYYPLCPYDVILTGTPEGVSKLSSGDSLTACLQSENREILTCHWDVI